jgi:hypothetical protein
MRFDLSKAVQSVIASLFLVAAATGSALGATYTLGGKVIGMTKGESITLQNFDGKKYTTVTVTSNGSYTFPGSWPSGASFQVTIKVPPTDQLCWAPTLVGKFTSANVTNMNFGCGQLDSIGGTIKGLAKGNKLALNLHESFSPPNVTQTWTGTGSNFGFTFGNPPDPYGRGFYTGDKYTLTIPIQPTGQKCTVSNGTGTIVNTDVKNIVIDCVPTYSIGGTITGLAKGATITLADKLSTTVTDVLNKTGTGASLTFTFAKELTSSSKYSVSVKTQPSGEKCTVTGGTGVVVAKNVTTVSVKCVATTTSYTIGGKVSGLTTGQSVVLEDNGANNTTVTFPATGFTFSTKVSSGNKYKVTVLTPPSGDTCNVANGSGTVVSSDITNVSVSCSSSGGGGNGKGGPFWIPYAAAPMQSTTDGKTGLFLIASGGITTSPAPQFVETTSTPHTIGAAFEIGTGTPLPLTPANLMYSALGGDGNLHIYGLTLNNTASLPAPVQISNLSLASTQTICSSSEAETDLSDPTTLFAVIEVGDSASQCGTGTPTFEVVHYTDSSSTGPATVSIDSTDFSTLYSDGKLVGLIHLDESSNNLEIFADETFSSPTTLLPAVQFYGSISVAEIDLSDPLDSNIPVFLNVTTGTGAANPSGLYYIDGSSKAIKLIHAGMIGDTVSDDKNLYFTDVTSTTETDIYQAQGDGSSATELYKGTYTQYFTGYGLVGSNDSVLVFDFYNGPGSSAAVTFYTIPLGTLTTTPTQIGSSKGYTGISSSFLAAPAGSGQSANKLFVDIESVTSGTPNTYAFSSLELNLDGSNNPTPTANSYYEGLGVDSDILGDGVYQVTGIKETTGGWGGGTMNEVNVSTLADTPFTTTGGGNYVVPTGYIGFLIDLGTGNTAVGAVEPLQILTAQRYGAAADLTESFLYQVTIKDTNVEPLF